MLRQYQFLIRWISCHVVEPPLLRYLNTTIPAVATSAAVKPAIIQYDVTLSAFGPQRCLGNNNNAS